MSTRSVIAEKIILDKGLLTDRTQYRAVYCHYDGYISGVGVTLMENYNSPESATAIVNLGSISVLAGTDKITPDPTRPHAFHNYSKTEPTEPQEGVILAYHRDRGENLEIGEGDDEDILFCQGGNGDTYIFDHDKGEWYWGYSRESAGEGRTGYWEIEPISLALAVCLDSYSLSEIRQYVEDHRGYDDAQKFLEYQERIQSEE